jgi:N-acetylmuramoyl-L-alanine amidase
MSGAHHPLSGAQHAAREKVEHAMTNYPFKAAFYDFGERDSTLGIGIHMTEGSGTINDVNFLTHAAKPGKGLVSANAVALADGTIYRMLAWDHAAGSFNPAARSNAHGYYSPDIIKAVLGDKWTNPNEYSVVIEIGGKRTHGPTDAQVEAVIAWGLEMREMFPTIRGAFGHHDQAPKGCPGTTENIKAIFDGIGGHGLFTEDNVRNFTMVTRPDGGLITGFATYTPSPHPEDDRYLQLSDGRLLAPPAVLVRPVVKVRLTKPIIVGKPEIDDWMLGWVGGKEHAFFILDRNVTVVLDP